MEADLGGEKVWYRKIRLNANTKLGIDVDMAEEVVARAEVEVPERDLERLHTAITRREREWGREGGPTSTRACGGSAMRHDETQRAAAAPTRLCACACMGVCACASVRLCLCACVLVCACACVRLCLCA